MADVPADVSAAFLGCPATPTTWPGDPPPFPQPACEDALPDAWLDLGTDPSPTLAVQIGNVDPYSKAFKPLQDGGWAALIHGFQGLTHVEVVPSVTVAWPQPGQLKASVAITGRFGCNVVAVSAVSTLFMNQQAAGTWSEPAKPKYTVFDFAGEKSWQLCGKWLELRARVRVPDGRWGEVRRRVRLWDTAPTAP